MKHAAIMAGLWLLLGAVYAVTYLFVPMLLLGKAITISCVWIGDRLLDALDWLDAVKANAQSRRA